MKIDLTTVTTINGKPLTQPEKNLLAKIAALGLEADDTITAAGNPVNGISCTCDPVVAALCKFVCVCAASYGQFGNGLSYFGKKVAIGTFDRVRYIVLRVDSKTYSTILD